MNTGRLSVRINDDTARALTNLVVDGRNATDVVRRALGLLDLYAEKEAEGKRLAFIDSENNLTEIVRMIW